MSDIKLLENLINYCSVKNNVISKNIANIGTQDYNREEVIFKDILSSEINSNLKATNGRHMSSGENSDPQNLLEIIADKNTGMVSGINNVDIEKEMADLAENTLQFKFAARKIGNYYKNLQKVIKGEPA